MNESLNVKKISQEINFCIIKLNTHPIFFFRDINNIVVVVAVVVLLFYVHGKHLRSCRDGQLTQPHFSWAGLDLLSG